MENTEKFTAKKLTAVLISVLMLLSLMPLTVFAEDAVIAQGQCGDTAYWKITQIDEENKTFTVYGTGDMWERTQWTGDIFDAWEITGLVIEPGITSIGDQAFGVSSKIKYRNVDLLTSFGGYYYAGYTVTGSSGTPVYFYYPKPFKNAVGNLTIPESVTTIGDNAFNKCEGFNGTLTIPNSVTSIGAEAFSDCTGFNEALVISDHAVSIGNRAFYGCTGFTGGLVLPDSVESIGNYAFSGCTGFSGDLVIPDSVTSVGEGAFKDCSGFDGNLLLSNNIERIEESAFSTCSGLKGNLVIPDSVKTIGEKAFEKCSGFDGTLTIGKNVSVIGRYAFSNCTGLSGSIIIPDMVTEISDFAFYYCSGFHGTLTLGKQVKIIGGNAFEKCLNLTGTLVIPGSAESVYNDAFYDAASYTNGSSTFNGKLEDCNTYKFFEHYRGDNPADKYQFIEIVAGDTTEPTESSDGLQVFYIKGYNRGYGYVTVVTVNEPIAYHATHTPCEPIHVHDVHFPYANTYSFELVTYCEEGGEHLETKTVSLTRVPAVSARIGQDGNIEYFTDEEDNVYIWSGSMYLPYEGSVVTHIHSFECVERVESNCATAGYEIYKCSYCDYSYPSNLPIAPYAHNWSEWTTTQPTCTVKGESKRVCLNGCGEEITIDLGYATHVDKDKNGSCDFCGKSMCRWCGKSHDTSTILGKITVFFHNLLYRLNNLF